MAATDAQIARVRRMVAEPTEATYNNASVAEYIEQYPLRDADGLESDNDDWVPTYDLHAASGDIWEEKAGAVADCYDMDADGAKLDRSQIRDAYMKQARHHRSRRRASSIDHAEHINRTVDPGLEDPADGIVNN